MEKTFILLRSHKQQGPYTLAQMAELNLKADELVFVENNIAGWRSAGEIDVLKPYISLANEGETQIQIPVKEVQSVQVNKPVPKKIERTLPTLNALKPVITFSDEIEYSERIQSAPVIISEQAEPVTASISVQKILPAREEAETEDVRDLSFKKDEPVAQTINRAPAVSYRNNSENVTPEYSGWLSGKKQKKEKQASKKGLLIGAAAVGVLAFGFILSQFVSGNTEPDKTTVVQSTVQTPGNTETKASIEAVLPKTETAVNLPVLIPEDEKGPEVEKSTTEPSQKNNVPKIKTETAIAAPAPKTSLVPATEEKKTTTETKTAEKTLQNQISVKSAAIENGDESGIYGLNVSLQNNSDKPLKMVAVNVFYTNDAGAVINKQTLYFSDVQPGQAVARAASGHKIATKAYCKLGLVSSEGKIYYEN